MLRAALMECHRWPKALKFAGAFARARAQKNATRRWHFSIGRPSYSAFFEAMSLIQAWTRAYSFAVGILRGRILCLGRVTSHPKHASQIARGIGLCAVL